MNRLLSATPCFFGFGDKDGACTNGQIEAAANSHPNFKILRGIWNPSIRPHNTGFCLMSFVMHGKHDWKQQIIEDLGPDRPRRGIHRFDDSVKLSFGVLLAGIAVVIASVAMAALALSH